MHDTAFRTYCSIAEGIALLAYERAESMHDCVQEYTPEEYRGLIIFDHYSRSLFEQMEGVLLALGILANIEYSASYFTITPPAFQALVERNWKHGPDFDELLQIFVSYLSEYGESCWDVIVEPNTIFSPKVGLISAFNDLTQLGYVLSTNEGYIWTEKIRPFMYGAGVWEEHPELD